MRSRNMGWIWLVAVVILCARVEAGEEKVENLLKNPGFEDVEQRGPQKVSKDWNLSKGGDVEILLDEQIVHGGKYSMRMFAVRPEGNNMSAGIWQKGIKVVPGKKYMLSAWVKAEGLKRAGWPGSIVVQFNCINSEDKRVMLYECKTDAMDTKEWKHITCTEVIPADAVSVNITCMWGNNKDGTIWFDDLVFQKTE